MPSKQAMPCTHPACGRLVLTGRCDEHRVRDADVRLSPEERGYGREWRSIRKVVKMRQPLCQHCRRAPTTDIDHILPMAAGGTNDYSNLQGLCKACHSRKTVNEDGGFGRITKHDRRS